MILNDVLTKQNVLTKLILVNGEKELSKELKVKVMRIRMAYNKLKKSFDEEVKEFTEELLSDEFKELSNKQDKSPEEEAKLQELTSKFNSEYIEFVTQKGNETINDDLNDSFTVDEYSDILDVNANNDVEINGNKIKATDFLEIFYELFIKE